MRNQNRLQGKVAVLTGGAGGIGKVIAQRYLEEGAAIVLTGRTLEKLEAAKTELIDQNPGISDAADRILAVAMDGSSPMALATGAEKIAAWDKAADHGIDILINNAGSAGPRQEIANIPLTKDDLERLKATGSTDTETLEDAVGSLLGSPWFTAQALRKLLAKGASIINVSTIFSRTEYYGRTAYVVPKAALNTLTRLMAYEFGRDERGIRVNTVYPGPVESERIHSVFATMDKLKGAEPGTTRGDVVGAMLLQHSPTGSNYLSKEEVADTIVFLGTDESTAFSGHDFEVTHGLQPPQDSFTHVIARPNLRVVDLEGRWVWILAGNQVEDATELAMKHKEMGAQVLLTFRESAAAQDAQALLESRAGETKPAEPGGPAVIIDLHDPSNPEHWHKADTFWYLRHDLPSATLVLPAFGAAHYGHSVLDATSENIQSFFKNEICGAITIAQRLDQLYKAADKRLKSDPVILYISNCSLEKKEGLPKNAFAELLRSGITQLIRTWRHENALMLKSAKRHHKLRINQLIRFENEEAVNLDLSSEWAVSLANGLREVRAIDVSLAPDLAGSLQNRTSLNWERQALRGLHLRKVALITGGSEGIGGETGRLLAISGARVALAARDAAKLERAREKLIAELKLAGYSNPESRVLIIPDCDVSDENAIRTMFDQTLTRFGRIDYLINNAGVSGAEQIVADLTREEWHKTLQANLISNYDLILKALPYMKRQKYGHILNVSSHFGGVRHATVAYPNRSDYAVSKAGQRALAESLAEFLGPDVQINAVAPGPVDGVRLRGTKDRPGLYARRAKLIFENKRLNLVYGALVTAYRCNENMMQALQWIAMNQIAELATSEVAPLRVLAQTLVPAGAGSSTHLLTRPLAKKLLERMKKGGYLPKEFETTSNSEFWKWFTDAPEPFIPPALIEADAAKIKAGVLSTLALQRMPSENDVAREMVFYLANRNITGETLHPSCGLTLDKLTMSGDFIGRAHPELLNELKHQHALLIGNAMADKMAALAAAYLGSSLEKVTVVLGSEKTKEEFEDALESPSTGDTGASRDPRLHIHVLEMTTDFDASLAHALRLHGKPDIVVSFPLSEIAIKQVVNKVPVWEKLPDIEEFKALIESQLTNHFAVASQASLIDRCRVIFVTPKVNAKAGSLTHAFANFLRTTLRPLTVTAGQEGSRLLHRPIFNQIDLLPSKNEQATRIKFLEAALLMSLPLQENANDPTKTANHTGTTITV